MWGPVAGRALPVSLPWPQKVWEHWVMTPPPCPHRRMPVSTKPVEDDVDVASERQRVLRGDADNDMVKIENLTKVGPGLVR